MKSLLTYFFGSALILVSATAQAQYGETIRTGRPGQAIGPFTVGARVFQVQAGVDYAAHDHVSSGQTISSDAVFRVGVTERFEMGLGIVYSHNETTNSTFFGEFTTIDQGISAFSLRVRSNVYEGKGAVPSVGFQVNLGLPAVSKDFLPMQVAPKLTAMTGQRFGKRVGLTTNWGAVWNGTSEIPSAFYVLNVAVDITGFMSTFIEHYANAGDNFWNGSVDGGFAFLITPNLQLDVLGGYGPFNVQNDWFVSTGISWRVRFKKKEKKE